MLSTRWIKLWRDIQMTPWRIALMLLTIAAGVLAFATMLSSYLLLSREVGRNYQATHPASAILQVDNIDAHLLAGVRSFPGIAQAQASSALSAAVYSADGTLSPLKIFVVEDFTQLHINTFVADTGAWPPAPNTLLLERSSLAQLKYNIGDKVQIRWSDGRVSQVSVSGTVHDPAMPVPSMAAFAYVSPSTLNTLAVSAALTELNISLLDPPADLGATLIKSEAIEQTASQLATWLQQQGHRVGRIRIPPPGEHPHQSIIFGVLGAFLMFSVIALVLSAVLTATIVDGLMARQVPQIGVMKTIGARATQIAGLYLVFVLVLAMLATALAMPAGLAAGLALSKFVLANLNFSLQSSALPQGAYWVLIAAGVLPPLGMAAVPIIKATQVSAQTALTNVGTGRQHYGGVALGSWLHRLPGVDRSLLMALRNCFRRRGRLVLILTLLASAGAMFMSGLNLKSASQQHLIEAAAQRHYDLEVRLDKPEDQPKIAAVIQSVPGVERVEASNSSTAARHRPDGLNIERTYADGGHGTLLVSAIPVDSQLLSLPMEHGHWLASAPPEAEVVLNRAALKSFPNTQVGDHIELGSGVGSIKLRVVGIANQKMTGGVAYVAQGSYQTLTGRPEQYQNFRVVMRQHDAAAVDALTKQIALALEQEHIKINNTLTENRLRYEVDAHFTLLINVLLFISLLMAAVGVLSLGSVMSTHVAERTREFGIMRSIGASSAIILRNVIIEGLFISLISWPLAIVLSLPLSIGISAWFGNLIFDEAFPLVISLTSLWAWFLMVVIGAALASTYPAWKATNITIYESLAF